MNWAGILQIAEVAVIMAAARPLALHPDNPHYLLFRGKPAVLITSGEHYGAVLNLDFDYHRYLDELARWGFNLTRTFSGVYHEVQTSFGIEENTLAPAQGRWICPWARSDQPGAADGGNKFDLTRWNPAYFRRLKDFVHEAGCRGIVVELVLFCVFYEDVLWDRCPMKAANNINGIGNVGRMEVYALKEQALTAAQEALVRKIATELAGFDNVYYELCNEPYFGGVTREWNQRMARAIQETEARLGVSHLIAENIANNQAQVTDPLAEVSILNFHYATPDAVRLNYGLGRAIADDETGFKGPEDEPYRREAWEFILSGGAIFSHLDYSFSVSHPDGTKPVGNSPGGGGESMRHQLAVLKRFLEGFDFVRLKPDHGSVQALNGQAFALVDKGRQYAVYLHGEPKAELELRLPRGHYRAEWLDTKTGEVTHRETFSHSGGMKRLAPPSFDGEAALRVMAR